MPARPVEAVALDPLYEQKGLHWPDDNLLSKHARLIASGLNAVASLLNLQEMDGLTGTRLQAIVPRRMMARESLRGIA